MTPLKYISTLLLLVLLLTNCKTDKAPQEEEVIFQRNGNEVIIRLENAPDRINPITTTNSYGRQIVDQIFMYPINLDPQSLEYIPELCKARPKVEEIQEGPYKGGFAYAFEIRDEAVWDNGTPVTGHDYVFTLKATLNPKVLAPHLRAYLTFIKDVKVDEANPKKFTVYIGEKYIKGEEGIGNSIGIMPEYLYDAEGLLKDIPITDLTNPKKAESLAESNPNMEQFATAFNSNKYSREKGFISGCGPYQFEEWVTGERIVLSKKKDWWGDKLTDKENALSAYPDRLIFRPITNSATLAAAVKAEEIDVASNLTPSDFLEIRELDIAKERYNFHTPLSLVCYFIYTNTKSPKLSDKRVRQALAHSFNVPEILETVYSGFGEQAFTPVYPTATYVNKKLEPYKFDVEKAKSLLNEAGWSDSNNNGIVDKEIDGELVELNLRYFMTPGRETARNSALIFQDNAKKAGINIEIVGQDFNISMGQARQGDFELFAAGRTIPPTLWEPKQNWHTTSVRSNLPGFGNAETDAIIEEIQVTLDEVKRNELYKKLQAIIYDEQPILFFFVPKGRVVIHKRFEASPSPMFPGFFPNNFKLKQSELKS